MESNQNSLVNVTVDNQIRTLNTFNQGNKNHVSSHYIPESYRLLMGSVGIINMINMKSFEMECMFILCLINP